MPDQKSRKFYRQLPTPFIAAGHKATTRIQEVSTRTTQAVRKARKSSFIAAGISATQRADAKASRTAARCLNKFQLTRSIMDRLSKVPPEGRAALIIGTFASPVPMAGIVTTICLYALRGRNHDGGIPPHVT